jgi:hypothetical protein
VKDADEIVDLINVVSDLLFGRLATKNEVMLLLGTVAVESGWYGGIFIRKQYGGGPARGIVQMEGNTGVNIFKNYLVYKRDVYDKTIEVMNCNKIISGTDKKPFKVPSKRQIEQALETNDKFAILMARLHYMRVPEKIPDNIISIADYYKKYYNTIKGADMFISRWNYYNCKKIIQGKGY